MKETAPNVIIKVALAVFKDQKILMARYRNKQNFYFVGGQLREGETNLDCLVRKTEDEIGVLLNAKDVQFLHEFEGIADSRENTRLIIRLYKAVLPQDPKPSHDVEEVRFLDSSIEPELVSPIATDTIFPWLKEQGYII